MITIAIDPGVHRCACATIREGRLTEAWFETAQGHAAYMRGEPPPVMLARDWPHDPRLPGRVPVHVAVEMPEYQGERSDRSKTQTLLALSWHGAMLAGQFAGRDAAPVFSYPVSVWKGSIPKPLHHRALWKVLDDNERKILGGKITAAAIEKACEKGALKRWKIEGVKCYPEKFATHNLLDATALGLHHEGRFRVV